MRDVRSTRWFRSSLRSQGGFTLVEAIVAITVIFTALTLLALVATSGFRYIAVGRDRQAATGIATRLMEQVRALSISTIEKGMKTSDLAGDSNIKTPAQCGDASYHYLTCAGEKIVHSSDSATVSPIVPHTGTLIAPEYPTTYSWAAYITNSNPTNDPYRLTIYVSWAESATPGGAKFIQLQSLWKSPTGCAAAPAIHPFAGPCQPYFNGSATVNQGSIALSGTVNGSPLASTPALHLSTAETRAAVEQVSQMQASVLQSGVRSGSTEYGLQGVSTSADGNPTTSSSPYDPASPALPPKTLSPTYGSIPVTSSPVALTLANDSGANPDAGSAVSADAASATTKCPSSSAPWPSFQADSLPCSWAQGVRGHPLVASVDVTKTMQVGNNLLVSAGNTTLAQVGEAGTAALDSWADRTVPSGTTGRLDMNSVRQFGTIYLVGIPAIYLGGAGTNDVASITALARVQECTGSNYLIKVSNYSGTAAASSGIGATAPSGAVTTGTTVKYWDGSACQTYTGASGAASLNNSTAQQPTVGLFQLVRSITAQGKTGTIMYRVLGAAQDANVFAKYGGVTTSRTPSTGTTITSATSTINAPVQAVFRVQLLYTPPSPATTETVFDLTLTIDLGATVVRSQYTAAPTGG